jgi:hypothetical protein
MNTVIRINNSKAGKIRKNLEIMNFDTLFLLRILLVTNRPLIKKKISTPNAPAYVTFKNLNKGSFAPLPKVKAKA